MRATCVEPITLVEEVYEPEAIAAAPALDPTRHIVSKYVGIVPIVAEEASFQIYFVEHLFGQID
jgi:hypothetical protein